MKTLEDEFKEMKDELKGILEEEPELTLLNWAYGSSLHAWAMMGVQLRMYLPLIRSSKGLADTPPIYIEKKWGKKWLDGRPLACAFAESCEAPPSYACIPQYEDFKQSLGEALRARDAMIHDLGMSTTMHIGEFASTDSTESWQKRFKLTEVKIIRSCLRDMKRSIWLFSDMTSHLDVRLGVHR